MALEDERWKQRFTNYERAFLRLKEAIDKEHLNELERNGLVQRFEFTLDVSWKVMKDFLTAKGFAFKPSPKDTIRQAAEAGYIKQAQELIDGLDIRNELSHDYSGEKFEKNELILRQQVYPALQDLYKFLKMEIENESR